MPHTHRPSAQPRQSQWRGFTLLELLVVLAENDERVNASWPPYEAALKAAGVHYTLLQPPGTQHGFHNNSTPRYDEVAAKASWERTLAHFRKHLT